MRKYYPQDLVTIEEEINPADFEVTAILKHLEIAGKYPLVFFASLANLKGEVSQFPLISNLFARRDGVHLL